MLLTHANAKVRRSIVAFASKAVITQERKAPAFPTIIGTGFVVDDRGIVATNRHVVRALERLPTHPRTGASAAMVLAFSEVEAAGEGHAMKVVFVSLRRWDKLTTLKPKEEFYGEPLPDLAFAQVNVRGLPVLPLATNDGAWEVGRLVATAGFHSAATPWRSTGASIK